MTAAILEMAAILSTAIVLGFLLNAELSLCQVSCLSDEPSLQKVPDKFTGRGKKKIINNNNNKKRGKKQ